MECLLQYWDDLDDLVGMIGLQAERLRRAAIYLLVLGLYAAFLAIAVYIALNDPPLAVAVVLNLAVALLHRGSSSGRAAAA